ncbi:MAG: hypothetical protein WKF37_14305 [Bryobacteraceae bacterium]
MSYLKQIPHALGSDKDFEGDFSFSFPGPGSDNTLTEVVNSVLSARPGVVIVALASLLILMFWDRLARYSSFLKFLPAPLVVVLGGVAINQAFAMWAPHLQIKEQEHLVSLPVAQSASAFFSQFQSPD